MKSILEHLLARRDLTIDQADALLRDLASGKHDAAAVGGVLIALRAKGETSDEVAGFARATRALATRPRLDHAKARHAIDIVGTGGDGIGTFNLSTAAALLCAAAGLPVVKHGNRAISSTSGSADVLAHLGLPMPLDAAAAATYFERTGFTFLFAPHFHPAVGVLAPLRRALGVRTIFNMLGPLTNPATPPFGLIGAYSPVVARVMAGAFATIPIERVLVVHSHDGLDEPTPASPFTLFEVTPGSVQQRELSCDDFGLSPCTLDQLKGGDPAHNAAALRRVMQGEHSAHSDAVLMSAALALWCGGRAASPREGVALAKAAITDGRAHALLTQLATVATAPQTKGQPS